MNKYFLFVEHLIEDHFSESDKELLIQKLGKKKPRPEEMTENQKLRNHFRQSFLNKKKRN